MRCGPAPETRCISFNNGKGKKTAWRAWKAYDDVTEIFVHLAKHPFQLLDVDCQEFQKLERLTVILYDKSSPVSSINQARKELFCIWATSTQAEQMIPSPQGYGWTKELGSWVLVWSTIPEVSRACKELIKCSCKGDCSTCKCGTANLDCSPLCKCNC